jgi:RNA polymerase sigma-70 factor (ECF subfamily)
MMYRADQKLAQRVLSGDGGAAAVFLARFQRSLFNLFMWLTRDPELSEDLTQDTIVRCWERLHQYRGTAALRTWVHKVGLSQLAGHKRREARDTRTLEALTQARSADARSRSTSQLEARIALADALAQLPAAERRVVILCKLQGFTLAEAAAMLDQPTGTVAWQVAEGLNKLRDLLADRAPERRATTAMEVSSHVSDRTQAARPK